MSFEATTWVMNSTVGNSTRKLVLHGYANHAHKDGTAAWASTSTIAEYAECDERTVSRHIGALLADGFIREGDQRLVEFLPADKRPIVYDLAMTEATRLRWQAEAAANPPTGRRGRAAAAGRKGGIASRGKRGDNLSPGDEPAGQRGDNLAPREIERGDNVTPRETDRPDTAVTPRGDKTGPSGVTPVSPKPTTTTNHPVEPTTSVGEADAPKGQGELIAFPGPATEPEVHPEDVQPKGGRRARIKPDWWPGEPLKAWATAHTAGTGLNLHEETLQFKDHHTSRATTMADWDAAYRTWIRNAKKWGSGRGAGTPGAATNLHRTTMDEDTREDQRARWNGTRRT